MTPSVALSVLFVTVFLTFFYVEWRTRGASKTRSAVVVTGFLTAVLLNIASPGMFSFGLGASIGLLGMLLLPPPLDSRGQVRA